MPVQPSRPAREEQRRSRVDEFAQSVHASYLSRWLSHDPEALRKLGQEVSAERRRKRRTSAA
jgi:hypothetical protein